MATENTPKCYAYVRMSTAKQVDSPETQRAIHRKYADFHNLGPDDIITFTDAAVSGKIPLDKREAGRELLRRLKRGDHVIISRLDRMFRNTKDCLIILDEFVAKGVNLHVCDLAGGCLDLTSPIGRLVITMIASVAQLERDWISQRTKAGLANKKRNHQQVSRFPGYGFKWERRRIEGKHVKVAVKDDEERGIMRQIALWRMAASPFTWEEIACNLDVNGIRTRDGGSWDINRVRRAFAAEMTLRKKGL